MADAFAVASHSMFCTQTSCSKTHWFTPTHLLPPWAEVVLMLMGSRQAHHMTICFLNIVNVNVTFLVPFQDVILGD